MYRFDKRESRSLLSKETYKGNLQKKNCLYETVHVSNETYKGNLQKETFECVWRHWGKISHVKRDLYFWNETCLCKGKMVHVCVKRGPCRT